MTRSVNCYRLALVLFALAGIVNVAVAGTPPLRLQATGQGVFAPANIGTNQGSTAGVVLGDGSGLSAYQASGQDFRLNGKQFGLNKHLGAVQSTTTGTLVKGQIVWPGHAAPNPYLPGKPAIHVMETKLGNIYFTYKNPPSRFVLTPDPKNPQGGVLQGFADFVVVGGTGRFKCATGLVKVVVTSNLATDVTPTGVRFQYNFDGFITPR